MYEISVYAAPGDRQCPYQAWLECLDKKTQARVKARLDRIRAGNFGDHHSVGSGVYELRLMFGAGYRIYYGIVDGQIVLLLGGGSKKRQNRDIQNAQICWMEYNER
jgi:putative addiction module killer protein